MDVYCPLKNRTSRWPIGRREKLRRNGSDEVRNWHACDEQVRSSHVRFRAVGGLAPIGVPLLTLTRSELLGWADHQLIVGERGRNRLQVL